ncbi:hypothetical protein P8V03_16955 [Clostridium sp. A1-XYC3]|uniref:Uncharacterized protein n=1 Tax=Clostridium tanneri TaxID=3037988 RepID=A0ABU4JY46_9CLOT|nr:hypothetical protein [Clostridium sp. A1-XYC3]MDW8802836.1 hypothetical protein [Clostridium sp. A1-XYC3]
MRAKRGKYNNEEAIIIYVSKSEEKDEETLEKIKNYREQCQNVCVFVGGSKILEDILEKILQDVKHD